MEWHIGCSGFMYREWRELFYPQKMPQKNWLGYYATQFDTLELNSSFYKFPEAKSLVKFYDQTPEDFSVSLKVPRLITHYKQMKECGTLLEDFYRAVSAGLQSKAGCILFQFPPKFVYNEERMLLLSEGLKKDFRNVVEFRDASWFKPEVLKRLKSYGIIVSGLSHPTLLLNQDIIQSNDIIYYRFHGIPTLFYSEYPEQEITEFADKMKKKKTKAAYVYFNNTASLAAIKNSTFLKAYIEKNSHLPR